MTPLRLEAFLARLYTDEHLCRAVLEDPRAPGLNLADDERALLATIDRVGLELAARSFAAKRRMRRTR